MRGDTLTSYIYKTQGWKCHFLKCLRRVLLIFWGKLHFITLNYALDYTLHPKLFDCTFCTINYHTYHTLHPGVIFAVIFNRILLHMTSTCFLLRYNKVKRLKHPSSKSIKIQLKNFHISLCLTCCHPLP